MKDSGTILVRDITEADIPLILDYWFRSPTDFLENMGVDLAKMGVESERRNLLRDMIVANKCHERSKLSCLVITENDKAIGMHTLYPLVENDHAVFHAHLWKAEDRGRGIGLKSYPKACEIFMERFNLNRILFKTPIQNIGALRVKEKLGIRCVGEEEIGFGIIKAGTRAKVFELTRSEIDTITSHLKGQKS